jgi:hypothetical protein
MEKSISLDIFRRDNLNLYQGRTVLKIPYSKGAWIIISFGKDKYRSSIIASDLAVHGVLTFFYDTGKGVGAEWEPKYGPIQIWYECKEGWEGEDCFGNKIEARKHWFYKWVKDEKMAWSQNAVDSEQLKENLIAGNLDYIFLVLKKWAESNK